MIPLCGAGDFENSYRAKYPFAKAGDSDKCHDFAAQGGSGGRAGLDLVSQPFLGALCQNEGL